MSGQALSGSVALVTGAASGIGRASALALATAGAQLALADRNLDGAEGVRASIAAAGGKALTIEVEISDSASVDRMVATTLSAYGRLDVVVHCAAILKIVPVIETTDEDWRRILGVDLDGTFFVSRAAARVMVARRSGRIILLTSGHGLAGGVFNAAYSAAKGGVNALMQSLAREVGSDGVMVNAINPGQTETPLMRSLPNELLRAVTDSTDPLKRIGKPEDVAEAVVFLATNTAFITGQIYNLHLAR